MALNFWDKTLTFTGFISMVLLPTIFGQTYLVETELRNNLSSDYHRFVRPSTPVTVHVFYSIRALQKIDIAEQQMILCGWITMFWTDQRLTWNQTEHNIDAMEINWAWRPEFTLGNLATGSAAFGLDNDDTRVRVYSSGNMHWNAILSTTTTCDVDISNFPFDTQTCDISILFWGFRVSELTLNSTFDKIQTFSYVENAEWELVQTSVNMEVAEMCCPRSNSPIIQYFLTFRRRRPFYVMNLVVPTILMSFCMVLVFLLPTDSGERLGFALTITLAYTVQLSIISQMMPTTSKQVPHIAKYLLVVLVMCSLVTFNVVINVKLYHKNGTVYNLLKMFYKRFYPVVFFHCRYRRKRTDECKVEALKNDAFEKTPENEMTSYEVQRDDDSWMDARLQWNETEQGINALSLNWAWTPDFIVSNSVKTLTRIGVDETTVRVYSSGFTSWNAPMQTETTCEVDISNFPFDTQTCWIMLIFWDYREDELILNSTFDKIGTAVYSDNAEWELLTKSVTLGDANLCCPHSDAPYINYSFTYRRRRPFYVMNLVVPTTLMSFCMVLVFLLPTDSGEKLGFALTITLAYTVQLSIISQMMPTTSKQVPHIAQYLLVVLVMCSMVTFNVVINVKLYHKEGTVYSWLQILYKKLYPVVFIRCRCRRKTVDECNVEEFKNDAFEKTPENEMASYDGQSGDDDSDDVTWKDVSVLLDRLCFYIYVIAVLGCTWDFFCSIII